MDYLEQIQKRSKASSFFKGFMSIYSFDLVPTPIKNPFDGKTDAEAIGDVWKQVGGYLQQAMNDFDHEQKAKNH